MTVLMQMSHPALQRTGKRAAVVPKSLLICSKVPAPVLPHHRTRICSQVSLSAAHIALSSKLQGTQQLLGVLPD